MGTSTVAAMGAMTVARTGQPVRLSASGPAGVERLASILAGPVPAPDRASRPAPA